MIWLGLIILFSFSGTFNSFNADLDHVWTAYRDAFAKPYDDASKDRLANLRGNAEMVTNHNIEAELGKHTYWLGLNDFSDMSDEEFDRFRNCISPNDEGDDHENAIQPLYQQTYPETPREIDYRKCGLVSPVRNQGICNSCYAIASLGALEGQWAKNNKLQILSVQNAIDCAKENGCNGGMPQTVYRYIIRSGGIDTEQSYPYHTKNEKCKFKKSTVGAKASSFFMVPPRNETILKEAVYEVGPISVLINSTVKGFAYYKSGVFDPVHCSGKVDHAVLLTGYGIYKGINKPYWLLKNSWGTDWGCKGYMYLVRNKNHDNCGITLQATYPVI